MGTGNTTRPTLLSRLRNGSDELAWREFDERYRELILRYARRRGLQESDAEDTRQLVMMGLVRALPAFRYQPEVGRFRDYLRAAVDHAIARVRVRVDRADLLDHQTLDATPATPTEEERETWEREWAHAHLRRAFRKSRSAFDARTLAVFDHLLAGASPREVAAAFGISRDAVYKIRQRVGDHLRQRIAEQIDEEEFDERDTG